MSYTIIYKVPEQGEITEGAEIHNAWRGAMHIWQELAKRYLPSLPDGYLLFSQMQQVWDLHQRHDIPEEHRITLLTTFDKVMVQREHLPHVIASFERFATDFGPGSLLEQAAILRQLADDPACYAVCWCQTSVSDDIWWSKERTTDDEIAMWDIARDVGHWFLFAEAQLTH